MTARRYIIGLDPSLCAFGISVFTENGKFVEACEINSKYKGERRLTEIEDRLIHLFLVFPTVFVLKEAYAYARVNQAHQLGELGWAVKRILYNRDIPFCEVAPQTLKKFVTGAGKGEKTKGIIIREVFRKWDFVAKTDNEADAYGIGKLGYAVYKKLFMDKDVSKTGYERACVESVLKSKKGIIYGKTHEEVKRQHHKKIKRRNGSKKGKV